MTYEEACRLFSVKPTRRQAAKWKNGQGRAYKLAQGLDTRITSRREENARIDEENFRIGKKNEAIAVLNKSIEEFNEPLEKDDETLKEFIPHLPRIPQVPLFEAFEVNMILGQ